MHCFNDQANLTFCKDKLSQLTYLNEDSRTSTFLINGKVGKCIHSVFLQTHCFKAHIFSFTNVYFIVVLKVSELFACCDWVVTGFALGLQILKKWFPGHGQSSAIRETETESATAVMYLGFSAKRSNKGYDSAAL